MDRPTRPDSRVGLRGLEPRASTLSVSRSNHLSYKPGGAAPEIRGTLHLKIINPMRVTYIQEAREPPAVRPCFKAPERR